MEGLPNGGLLLGTRFQLEELQADSRRVRKQTRNRTTATAVMSSIRSIFGTILNRSAHDAYRARYMLQQQWRSITDATLQQCAERRIALIKENSQVKKNNFSKKIAQTGSRHTAEESADDSPVRKIIFSEKGKTGSRYIAKNLQKYLEPENTEKFEKKEKINEKQIATGFNLRTCTAHRQAGSDNAHQFQEKQASGPAIAAVKKAKETPQCINTLLDKQDPRGYNQNMSDQDPRTIPDKQNCPGRGM